MTPRTKQTRSDNGKDDEDAGAIEVNDELLVKIGLGSLNSGERADLLIALMEEVEGRVGKALASLLTESELTEFETYIDSGDDDKAIDWLAKHCPNHRLVVRNELQIVTAELKSNAKRILAALGTTDERQAAQW